MSQSSGDWLTLTSTLKLFEGNEKGNAETNNNVQKKEEREESGLASCESETSSPSCSKDEENDEVFEEGKILRKKLCCAN